MLVSQQMDVLAPVFAVTCIELPARVVCFYTGKEDGPAYEN